MIKRIGQWSNLFSIWEVFMQAHCYGYILGKNPGIFPMLRGGITIFWDRWENTFYSKKTEKSVIYCIPTLRLTMLQQLHWMDWRPLTFILNASTISILKKNVRGRRKFLGFWPKETHFGGSWENCHLNFELMWVFLQKMWRPKWPPWGHFLGATAKNW